VLAKMMREPLVVYFVLAIYFAVHVSVRLLSPHSLELDEAQQLYFAQWLAPGYDDQPPFYNWLQYGLVQVFGVSLLSLALLKNAMLFCTYLLVGLAGRLTLRNRSLEVIAVLGLLTLPQIAFEAQRDLTHSVAAIFGSALFVACAFWALRHGSMLAYAMTGIATGIAVLSKYNVALMPMMMFIAVLLEPELRGRLMNWRIVLTAIFAAAVLYPHARWFFDNTELATAETVGKLTLASSGDTVDSIVHGLLGLAEALLMSAALTVAVFWIAFGRRFQESWSASSPWSRVLGRTLLLVVLAIALLVVFGGVSTIKARWLMPYFVVFPLYLCLKLDALNQTISNAPKRFGWMVAAILVAIPVTLLARAPMAAYLGSYKKQNVPYAGAISEILASGSDTPSLVLASDTQLSGNIRVSAPDIPVMTTGYGHRLDGETFDSTHPVLLIWRDKGAANAPLPDELRAMLASMSGMEGASIDAAEVAKPYHYGRPGDLYHFRYAWAYPAANGE
jgi:4-amino-4-deoxy-L-arabinose transferase-like glycosyltransferase